MIPRWLPDLTLLEILSALFSSTPVSDFERAAAAQAGVQYGLAFGYAHAGFYALLKALGLTQAEIVIPAYTCEIMPAVIVTTGNIPVFVDINLDDYDMDLVALKSAITNRTRMIVATNMFGYPSNIDAIRGLVDGRQIIIVEDAALTFPGSIRLRGEVGLFSFGPGKPLFTIRGGVLVTNAPHLYERLASYRARVMGELPLRQQAKRWGLLAIHYLRSRKPIYDVTGRLNLSKDTFHKLASRRRASMPVSEDAMSSLPSDYATRFAAFQATLGLTQLGKSDAILARRRAVAQLYGSALRGIPGLTPAPVVGDASYSLYTVRVRERDAQAFRQQMHSRGIETGRTFGYAAASLRKYRPYARGACLSAVQASKEIVNLPAFTDLTGQQIGYISDTIRQVLDATGCKDSEGS